MSSRLEGERVFCHQCSTEWDRAHGGLTCPECHGEFTEILEPGASRDHDLSDIDEDTIPDPPIELPPSPRRDRHPLHDHNPWAETEPRNGFRTFEFSTPHGGRGMFSFSSSTYTSNGRNMPPLGFPPFMAQGFGGGFQARGGMFRDGRRPPGPGEMQDLFSMIFQTMQNAQQMGVNRQNPDGAPPSPFDLLGAILNPGNGRQGDFIFSQEALERFMEQTQQSNAPPPASEEAIQSLSTKEVTKEMMGNDGTAECSICMDNVEVGSDVTVLPCNHWFHGECVVAWLKEHDTCPHCRKPITSNDTPSRPPGSRRRSSRRSSYNTNPYGADGTRDDPTRTPQSPGELREARRSYYGRMEFERPENRRHSSSRSSSGRHHSSRQNSSSGSSGGVTGWIRNRMGI